MTEPIYLHILPITSNLFVQRNFHRAAVVFIIFLVITNKLIKLYRAFSNSLVLNIDKSIG
jgi:hypothetical protein